MNLNDKSLIYRRLIQILLILVVIPMAVIMIYGVKESIVLYKKNKLLSIFIFLCSIIPFLHVLINDAYRFGFYF